MKLKKIGVLSLGINFALFGVLLGLLSGLGIALVSLLGAGATGDGGVALVGAGMGLLAIVIVPISYGAIMFISGVIGALIYNLVFKVSGGLELDLE